MIYCTDCGAGGQAHVYNGTAWTNMIGGTATTQPPTVASTTAASNITFTSARSGGNITNDFGNTIIAMGVCWSTSQNPTTANSKTTESGTTGSFTSVMTGLTHSTLYYVRAYATNAAGTSYAAQVSFTTSNLQIGDSYQGGKIAYFLQPGDPGYDANVTHGLIATVADVSSGAPWGCSGTSISSAQNFALGAGFQNTVTIVNSCGIGGIAAWLCFYLVQGGYDDWYLPSLNELEKFIPNKVLIGGFSNSLYWSSSESLNFGHNDAQPVNFGSPFIYGTDLNKTNTHRVRAIRSF